MTGARTIWRQTLPVDMRDFHLGTISGIPIRANLSLVLFLPVLAWIIARGGQIEAYAGLIEAVSTQTIDLAVLTAGNTAWLIGFAGAIGLFVSVLLHELGHSWMARRYDIEIVSITLWIFGGMARMRDIPEEWDRELWIALAGPAVSLVLGIAGVAALAVVPSSTPVLTFVIGFLGVVNLVLVGFNLLPAFPMDGGRVLRALLARNQPYARATQTAATIGKGMAVLMGLVGLLGNPVLILIALFVYMAASQESRATVVRELLRGLVVSDVMTANAPTIEADATLDEFVGRAMFERLSGFPVIDNEEVVGVITMDGVKDIPAGERSGTAVRSLMDAAWTVAPDDDAYRALQGFGETSGPLVVTDADGYYGVVTQADVVRALEVMQGVGPRDEPELAPEGFACGVSIIHRCL